MRGAAGRAVDIFDRAAIAPIDRPAIDGVPRGLERRQVERIDRTAGHAGGAADGDRRGRGGDLHIDLVRIVAVAALSVPLAVIGYTSGPPP